MRFDWTDLRIFLHVCDAGSMTAAAERAHLSLAAVSARMRSLEEANGVVLLERQARGVAPTDAGLVLAAHAREVFGQVQQLERDLLVLRQGETRRTVLLTNSSALTRPLQDAVVTVERSGRSRGVLVRESASEATVQAIRAGVADVGIVSDSVETRGLIAHDLGLDPLVFAVAPGHAFASRESVSFEDALSQPWIAWGEQSALSTHLLMHAMAQGQRFQPRITYPRANAVLQLVAQGLGVTVLPQAVLVQQAAAAEVVCVKLEESWAQRRLLVVHQEGGDAARGALARAVVEHWPRE
jgi:DNA-binding transcriptional LysR family regulator